MIFLQIGIMRRVLVIALVPVFLCIRAVPQWVPQSKGMPTEKVITEYEKLVAQGTFLSSGGWKTASKIYLESHPYPEDGAIQVVTTGGGLGEDWNRDNHAEVESKWTDHFGTIDSNLRFKAPDGPCGMMMIFNFKLVYTDKHRDIARDGKVTEHSGPWEWKIDSSQKDRVATIPLAIAYVRMMRDKSKDPAIKKNANETIRILKRFTLPSASAC
jgi:hypothetical protein